MAPTKRLEVEHKTKEIEGEGPLLLLSGYLSKKSNYTSQKFLGGGGRGAISLNPLLSVCIASSTIVKDLSLTGPNFGTIKVY